MAAVAIVKDPSWAEARRIPAPRLVDGKWVERPDNPRTITLWENFDRDRILADFFRAMDDPRLARRPGRASLRLRLAELAQGERVSAVSPAAESVRKTR